MPFTSLLDSQRVCTDQALINRRRRRGSADQALSVSREALLVLRKNATIALHVKGHMFSSVVQRRTDDRKVAGSSLTVADDVMNSGHA